VEQRNAMMRRNAEASLKRTSEALSARGVVCSVKILEGDPVSAVLAREARKGGYDLIAMSSRGLGKQKDTLHYLGSVTEHLIRRSQIPVLVIPVSEEEKD
jgi:nucleotide-binding universal stress UspA family protein